MWFGIPCILVILVSSSHCTDSGRAKNKTCECDKPVFMLHGLTSNKYSLTVLENRIRQARPRIIIWNSNAYPDLASLIVPLPAQIKGELGREFRKFSDKYPCGIIAIGYSQGAILLRALVQSYLYHNVHVLILIAGPVAGIYGFPLFLNVELDRLLSRPLLLSLASDYFYTPSVQRSFSFANFWRDPHRLSQYFRRNIFLPYIDNEKPSNMSQIYKAAFIRIGYLVVICGCDDGFNLPYQTSFFSFYDKNENVVNYKDRAIYTEDLFGLRTLDSQGRYIIYNRSGIEHIEWVYDPQVFQEFILPHLQTNPSPCHDGEYD